MMNEEVLARRSHQEAVALLGVKPLHPSLLAAWLRFRAALRLYGGRRSISGRRDGWRPLIDLDGSGASSTLRAVAALVPKSILWSGLPNSLQDYRVLGHLDHDCVDTGPMTLPDWVVRN